MVIPSEFLVSGAWAAPCRGSVGLPDSALQMMSAMRGALARNCDTNGSLLAHPVVCLGGTFRFSAARTPAAETERFRLEIGTSGVGSSPPTRVSSGQVGCPQCQLEYKKV